MATSGERNIVDKQKLLIRYYRFASILLAWGALLFGLSAATRVWGSLVFSCPLFFLVLPECQAAKLSELAFTNGPRALLSFNFLAFIIIILLLMFATLEHDKAIKKSSAS